MSISEAFSAFIITSRRQSVYQKITYQNAPDHDDRRLFCYGFFSRAGEPAAQKADDGCVAA